MNDLKMIFRVHAVQRMFERRVSAKQAFKVLQTGKTIEDYSSEMPEPGRLILGFQGNRPLHIVIAENPDRKELIIITVYVPDRNKWNKEFKSRSS